MEGWHQGHVEFQQQSQGGGWNQQQGKGGGWNQQQGKGGKNGAKGGGLQADLQEKARQEQEARVKELEEKKRQIEESRKKMLETRQQQELEAKQKMEELRKKKEEEVRQKQEELRKKQEEQKQEQERRIAEGKAMMAIRRSIQKIRTARADNFEEVKTELEQAMATELPILARRVRSSCKRRQPSASKRCRSALRPWRRTHGRRRRERRRRKGSARNSPPRPLSLSSSWRVWWRRQRQQPRSSARSRQPLRMSTV